MLYNEVQSVSFSERFTLRNNDITKVLSNETKEQRRCFSEKKVPRVLNVYRIYSLNNLELPESFLRLSVLPKLNKQVVELVLLVYDTVRCFQEEKDVQWSFAL